MKKAPSLRLSAFSNTNALRIVVMVCAAVVLYSGGAAAQLTAKANHDHITVDFFYHGSSVGVSGISDPGTDLIVKITSPEGHQALKKKGKVGGVLWMNVGGLEFERVPSLYFLASTKKVEDILPTAEQDAAVLGYESLGRHAEVRPVSDDLEKAKWFEEFLRFKEASKLYKVTDGNFALTRENGRQNYHVPFDWPYQAAPGDYTVTVYAVKGGKIVETAECKVLVEQVGIVKRLAEMAKNKGGLYGIISIMAALGAGFGVGLIFRKGGGSH